MTRPGYWLLAALVGLAVWALVAWLVAEPAYDAVTVRTVPSQEHAAHVELSRISTLWQDLHTAHVTSEYLKAHKAAKLEQENRARQKAPAAKPAPVVRAASYSGSIPDAIRRVFSRFGAHVAEQAVRVSFCESKHRPTATGSQGERGLMQIHPKYHQARIRRLGFTWDRMYEVEANLLVAADLYSESGWRPWSCRTAA